MFYLYFYSNYIRTFCHEAKNGEPDQAPISVASDLALHCLPIPHKKYAGLILPDKSIHAIVWLV